MKIELVYLRIIAALSLTIFLWLWAAPTCFNWQTDVAIPLGAICVVIAPILDYWLIKPILKNKK
jgi:hypothetical protein